MQTHLLMEGDLVPDLCIVVGGAVGLTRNIIAGVSNRDETGERPRSTTTRMALTCSAWIMDSHMASANACKHGSLPCTKAHGSCAHTHCCTC